MRIQMYIIGMIVSFLVVSCTLYIESASALSDPSGNRLLYLAPGSTVSESGLFDTGFMYSDNSAQLISSIYLVGHYQGNIFNLEHNEVTADYASHTVGSWRPTAYAAGDVNGDNADDVVICTSTVDTNYDHIVGGAIAYSDGSAKDMVYASCASSPAIADVDSDGFAEIVMTSGGQLDIWDHEGNLRKRISAVYDLIDESVQLTDTTVEFVTEPVIGRFGGNGYNKIFIVAKYKVNYTDNYVGFVVDGMGRKLSQVALGMNQVVSQPVAADADGDGQDEIIVDSAAGLQLLDANGSVQWTIGQRCYTPIVSNVDTSSDSEVLCVRANGGDSSIDAYKLADGSHLPNFPVSLPDTVIRSGPVTVKLAASHTTNDIIVGTTKGAIAFRGSDLQQLWTINAGKWCDSVQVYDFGEGVSVVTLCGDDPTLMQNQVYLLTDNGVALSGSIQEGIYPMSGYSTTHSYNFDGASLSQPDGGYRFVASDGGVFPFGLKGGYGSTGNINLWKPIVGMTETSTDGGYWLVASDGGIFPFGDAVGYGSTGNVKLWQPIVGMAKTPTNHGYWLVASDGGIFPFGDAVGYGSTGGIRLNKPIVGMSVTPSGHGYWLVASDGGIFPFGDAAGYGSTGNINLRKPIVGMTATPSGHGYWLVASDGGIFPFGDAVGYGSAGNINLWKPIVGMKTTSTGNGYWLVASDGGVFTYGDAKYYGSTGGINLWKPIVGIAQ